MPDIKNDMPEQLVLFPFGDDVEDCAETAVPAVTVQPVTRALLPQEKLHAELRKDASDKKKPSSVPPAAAKRPKRVLAPCAELDAFIGNLTALAAAKNTHAVLGLARVNTILLNNYRWSDNCYDFVSGETAVMRNANRHYDGRGYVSRHHYFESVEDTIQKDAANYGRVVLARQTVSTHFIYLTHSGETAVIPVRFVFTEDRSKNDAYVLTTDSVTVGKPAPPEKYHVNRLYAQTDEEMLSILRRAKPWLAMYIEERKCSCALKNIVSVPWLETLDKAGYAFADNFITCETIHGADVDRFNRLCGAGTSPKTIFKCRKSVYLVLKNETNMEQWDVYRRMEKTDKLNPDTIQMIYDRGWDEKTLEMANSILGQTYDNKRVFSWDSLVNYLHRLDMYEAIGEREALPLLRDYLNMCRVLGMQPRIDGDSLKREHDIAARLSRLKRNEDLNRKMREHAEKDQEEIRGGNVALGRSTYSEKVYFIRPVRDYEDLLDEARQQSNCVASYANWILEGKTRIYVMRETAHPDRSLITVELTPDCKTIRQKFLSHNRPIRNKSQSEFLDRWLKQMNAA